MGRCVGCSIGCMINFLRVKFDDPIINKDFFNICYVMLYCCY